MADLLIKLYDLPAMPVVADMAFLVRPALAYEKTQIVDWVRAQFGNAWASECDVAFARQPLSCHIATHAGAIIGFACYDSSGRGMFGPIGVELAWRGRGVGRALLLASLQTMAALGYAYAIVGAAGAKAFYRHSVGAMDIPDSTPGIYRDRLKP